MNINNELDPDNIITLTKYVQDILLTAITPYNKQDLFQWYKTNRQHLQKQFSTAKKNEIRRNEMKRLERECHHRRKENAQLQLEATRIENLKSQERPAAVARCAKARSERPVASPRNNSDHCAGNSAAHFDTHSVTNKNNNK